jgi:CheY-like chemotaxis protein
MPTGNVLLEWAARHRYDPQSLQDMTTLTYHGGAVFLRLTCHASGLHWRSVATKDIILDTTPIVSIIDDDEAVRLALDGLVQSLGWRALTYDSAEAYLASGAAGKTSCLVSDVKMPGMSGVDLCELLQAQGIAPATILVSAYATPAMKEKVRRCGALVLLEKPFDAATMTHWLGVAIEQA